VERKAPSSFDKQPVRNAGIEMGIKTLDNTSADDIKQAWSWKGTLDLVRNTTLRYRYIFWRLTGQTVEDFARELRVELDQPRRNVVILLGSESDLTEQLRKVVADALTEYIPSGQITSIRVVTNFSCHRQYGAMNTFARTGRLDIPTDGGSDISRLRLSDIDCIVAGAGMAAQLPAMLKAALAAYGKSIPIIGLGFGTPHTDAFEAARLSISQLPPGSTVHTDEINGQVYMNAEGLTAALARIATGEFPPLDPPTIKPIHIDVRIAV
jgi:phosphoribosylcarboxyaminoimidazole (NCAIR) mutase